MQIFLDSNIFYNNWHLSNANFKNFLAQLESSKSTLIISEIVCAEVDEKYNFELEKLQKALKSNLTRAELFLNRVPNFNLNELKSKYSIQEVISKETSRFSFVPFGNIPNSIIVNRAIKKIRPFQDQDKGYRDTLIWLSFIKYLDEKEITDDIIFITNNSNDFFNLEKTDFHSDLLDDIKELGLKNKFNIYTNINDFISQNSNEVHLDLSDDELLELYIYRNESLIEEEVESYINAQSTDWFINQLKDTSIDFRHIEFLVSYDFKIYEGIEDPELMSWTYIEESTIFVELQFVLRIVSIQLTIPRSVYNRNRQYLKRKFPDIKNSKATVAINTTRKVFTNFSFNINIETETIDDLVMNEFSLK